MTAHEALINEKHRAFVDQYVIDFNGAKAAVRAGYSARRGRQTANELLKRDDVKAAIAEKQGAIRARADVTVDEVVTVLATSLRANVLDYMGITRQGDAFVDFSAMTREQASALAEITVEDFVDGRGDDARDVKRVKFKLTDKLAAADKLLRHLGGYAGGKGGDAPPAPANAPREASTRDLAKALLGVLSEAATNGEPDGGPDGAAAEKPAVDGVRPAGEPKIPDDGQKPRGKREGSGKAAARSRPARSR